MYMHVCISWTNEIRHLPCYRNMPGANNDLIYVVVEFDKKLGVDSSTMEVVPDNWRDHEGNMSVLYPYQVLLDTYSRLIKLAWTKGDHNRVSTKQVSVDMLLQ